MNPASMNADTGHAWLTIGKITGVHGLAGNLKVWSFAQSPDTFGKGRQIKVQPEGNPQADSKNAGRLFTIARAAARKKGILLTLKGVDTIEKAQTLVGKEILIARDELPDLETDTWYWEDLYGLNVVDQDLGALGKVKGIFPGGAHDILVVTDKNRQGKKDSEVLIPMDRHFVARVDLESGCITTTLPQGYVIE